MLISKILNKNYYKTDLFNMEIYYFNDNFNIVFNNFI